MAIFESRSRGLLARWLVRHASSPLRVQREMTDAGYRLIATHDVMPGYWFGLFEVADSLQAETSDLTGTDESGASGWSC